MVFAGAQRAIELSEVAAESADAIDDEARSAMLAPIGDGMGSHAVIGVGVVSRFRERRARRRAPATATPAATPPSAADAAGGEVGAGLAERGDQPRNPLRLRQDVVVGERDDVAGASRERGVDRVQTCRARRRRDSGSTARHSRRRPLHDLSPCRRSTRCRRPDLEAVARPPLRCQRLERLGQQRRAIVRGDHDGDARALCGVCRHPSVLCAFSMILLTAWARSSSRSPAGPGAVLKN